jgi:hypothetical protein
MSRCRSTAAVLVDAGAGAGAGAALLIEYVFPCAMCRMDVSLRVAPEALVGRYLRVFWPLDDAWFLGSVEGWDPGTGRHQVWGEGGRAQEWWGAGAAGRGTAGEEGGSQDIPAAWMNPVLEPQAVPRGGEATPVQVIF